MNDDYLIHYGVLGMKWGVRKDTGSTSTSSRSAKKAAKYKLRSEREKRDSKTISDYQTVRSKYKTIKSTKGKTQAKAYKKTNEYKKADKAVNQLITEYQTLTPRETDKLYANTKSSGGRSSTDYGKEYAKAGLRSSGKMLAASVAGTSVMIAGLAAYSKLTK